MSREREGGNEGEGGGSVGEEGAGDRDTGQWKRLNERRKEGNGGEGGGEEKIL